MSEFQPTERTKVHRVAQRATYDRDTIYSILDEALVAHVGFVDEDQPYVLPMVFVRVGDSIYLHGSTRARMLAGMVAGHPVCATVTQLDGLILARSAFHHSVNYRSVAIIGSGRAVEDEARALVALEALTEKIAPGRWPTIRAPSPKEMKATLVVELPIDEVSAKVRTGPPLDDAEDLALDIWAGEIPIQTSYLSAIADPTLRDGIEMPDHVAALVK